MATGSARSIAAEAIGALGLLLIAGCASVRVQQPDLASQEVWVADEATYQVAWYFGRTGRPENAGSDTHRFAVDWDFQAVMPDGGRAAAAALKGVDSRHGGDFSRGFLFLQFWPGKGCIQSYGQWGPPILSHLEFDVRFTSFLLDRPSESFPARLIDSSSVGSTLTGLYLGILSALGQESAAEAFAQVLPSPEVDTRAGETRLSFAYPNLHWNPPRNTLVFRYDATTPFPAEVTFEASNDDARYGWHMTRAEVSETGRRLALCSAQQWEIPPRAEARWVRERWPPRYALPSDYSMAEAFADIERAKTEDHVLASYFVSHADARVVAAASTVSESPSSQVGLRVTEWHVDFGTPSASEALSAVFRKETLAATGTEISKSYELTNSGHSPWRVPAEWIVQAEPLLDLEQALDLVPATSDFGSPNRAGWSEPAPTRPFPVWMIEYWHPRLAWENERVWQFHIDARTGWAAYVQTMEPRAS
jgi:hypothetical protein